MKYTKAVQTKLDKEYQVVRNYLRRTGLVLMKEKDVRILGQLRNLFDDLYWEKKENEHN